MLHIRLSRVGKRKQPAYRLIVCEKSKDPWGKYIENLGNYNPFTKVLVLNADRVKYWLEKGAQPSDTVWNFLVDKGLVEGKKRQVTLISKKRAVKMSEKKKAGEPAPVAETPKEETAEPAPAEEKPEETPAEEPKAEPAPAEEKPEEVKPEAPADEPKTEEPKKE